MTANSFPIQPSRMHGTDNNSLMRLYHRNREVSGRAGTQIERDNAARSARLIARELLVRGVRV
jgi:hypothetical protein